MPDFMKNADRIVGGEAAPSMIPWQVAMLSGSFQFCGGTILDSCTILTAAHCEINTGHIIRAGSLDKRSGGQVRTLEDKYISHGLLMYWFLSSRFEVYHKSYQTQIFHITVRPLIMIGLLPNWILH